MYAVVLHCLYMVEMIREGVLFIRRDAIMNHAEKETGIIDIIITRLTPKVLTFLIAMGMLLLAAIVGIAVFRGSEVKIFGIEISQPSKACQEDLAHCRQALQASVTVTEFQEIVHVPLTKTQALDTLRALVKSAEAVNSWRANFNYRLFEIEQQMMRYGGFISTRIADGERIAVYRMIQALLSDLGFYEGPLDGAQRATHEALVAFQNDYNTRVTEAERISALGSFGYHTLEAVRSRYRQMSG